MAQNQNLSKELDDLSKSTIALWGAGAQIDMVIEESAELIKAICKWNRYGGLENEGKIIDELADMAVVLNHLRVIMGVSQDELDLYIQGKIIRTRARLAELESLEDIPEDPHY